MNEAEKIFLMMLAGGVEATEDENKIGRFDIRQGEVRVDVKAMKRINRSDEQPSTDFHYVEFKNINGDYGWVYGYADFIAFETEHSFIMVHRERLLGWCMAKIVSKEILSTPQEYKWYRRENRSDLMTLIPVLDLMKISTCKYGKKAKGVDLSKLIR